MRGTVEDGRRTFYDQGRKVLSGTDYLLPWDGGRKLYHYSETGGTSTWEVPGKGAYTLYELTDNGREKVSTVRPSGGRITLTATAGQAYVLYPARAPKETSADWGKGSRGHRPGLQRPGPEGLDEDGHGRP